MGKPHEIKVVNPNDQLSSPLAKNRQLGTMCQTFKFSPQAHMTKVKSCYNFHGNCLSTTIFVERHPPNHPHFGVSLITMIFLTNSPFAPKFESTSTSWFPSRKVWLIVYFLKLLSSFIVLSNITPNFQFSKCSI